MKPLIGITAGTVYNKDRPQSPFTYGQSHTYVEAISASGGIPVIIPILKSADEVREIIDRLDGLMFAGGNDLSSELYDEESRDVHEVDSPRDSHEVALMKLALTTNKPILAICRGMQLLNVVRGGTLYQDIIKEIPGAQNHDGYLKEEGVEFVLHQLSLESDSELAKILQTTSLKSNTFHHQAIKELGEDLVINARAEDGVIEGVEDMSQGYIMAVQPHPESLVIEIEPQWRRLFDSFIAAAKKS